MRSLLISVDFIYRQDGTLHPTELNTSTKDDLSAVGQLTDENFVSEVEGYFDHEQLNTFMIENNLSKITIIGRGGDERLHKAFASYYGYEFDTVIVGSQQITIPEVEDKDDTLIIRIAYDTYALIDDLYARDNYEFHNLIVGESFASPVTFNENGFDTIKEFIPSQDGVIPNYVVKARTPGYIETQYPKGYRFNSMEELSELKNNLGDDEFIAQFEFNDSLTLIDGRTHHLRTMSLICGPTLEVLNLVYYKSINPISTQNDLLVYDSEIDSDKKLNDLFLSKYYPNWLSKNGLNFHSDESDLILRPDDSLISFSNLQVGDIVKYIHYTDKLELGEEQNSDILDNPTHGISKVTSLTKAKTGIFINITATNQTHGTFTWYDGIGNTYIVRKPNQSEDTVLWTKAGRIEIGDDIMIYNNKSLEAIPFTVDDVSYDVKNLELYLISLEPKSEFLVKLSETNNDLFLPNNDLFLIQHNACHPSRCFFSNPVGANVCAGPFFNCNDCGKNSNSCINCGGSATSSCVTI